MAVAACASLCSACHADDSHQPQLGCIGATFKERRLATPSSPEKRSRLEPMSGLVLLVFGGGRQVVARWFARAQGGRSSENGKKAL